MKLNISLLIAVVVLQLAAFQLYIFQSDADQLYVEWYDRIDSTCWLMFSLFAYRVTKHLKTIGRPDNEAKLITVCRLITRMILGLSICPFINDAFGQSSAVLIGNYIYGMLIMIYHIVKIIRNVRMEK